MMYLKSKIHIFRLTKSDKKRWREFVTLLALFHHPTTPEIDMVVSEKKEEALLLSRVDDVLVIIKSDYDNAYFVTGMFSSSIYAEDCLLEDTTIKFRGRELYSRNLQLLVPFFEKPSIVLKTNEKGVDAKRDFVLANLSLRPLVLQASMLPLVINIYPLFLKSNNSITHLTQH